MRRSCLRLCLLLRLRRLLSGLLLGGFCGFLLCTSSGNSSSSRANCGAFPGIACDCTDCCSACCASSSTFYSSALRRLFPRLFCRLLLLCFLLFGVGLLRCSTLRIKAALLFRRAIALVFILELLVGILLILRISEHADALGWRDG